MTTITLDGSSLTIEQLVAIARDPSIFVERHPSTEAIVARGEELIAQIVENYRRAYEAGESGAREYGVTTGFGEFKDQPIAPDDLEQLQRNLLLSHSVGIGENTNADDLANYFSAEVVRGALATRLNAFLKGHSGVRRKLVDVVQAMLNRGVIPLVPLRGSVGASGDLCPLSHLFVVLLGEGRFYTTSDPTLRDAKELPAVLGFTAEELLPRFKEGLALVNGANFSTSMLALGVYDAERLAGVADAAAAMALEAMCGCTRALDPKVHDARGQLGQIQSASRIRELLTGSTLVERAGAVQDSYSLRCAPQVHGASRDAIRYAREIAERELNAATDNPLFFPDGSDPIDVEFHANWQHGYRGDQRVAYSAGNFHGQPIALASDFLAIAVAELANISERRTALLLDGNMNRRLPSNLTTKPGVHSGLMIAQYTAASIVSENKVLAHPASVDSIPTGANVEDHVSMSTHAARKMRTIVGNTQSVLALELLVSAQALDWRIGMKCDPLAERRVMTVEEAETQSREFEAVTTADVATGIAPALRPLYLEIRNTVPPVTKDRVLSEDARRVRALLFA
ncbi:MAG: histidine ammonia-lyase [Acidobacteria bacterium]|nr:histidine ammonia-lyase [Acidobacteriota bacterium]